jgi:hypothetical protein
VQGDDGNKDMSSERTVDDEQERLDPGLDGDIPPAVKQAVGSPPG